MKIKTLILKYWKKIITFLIGAIILSGSLGFLVAFGVSEYIKDMDRAVMEKILQYPLRESLISAFKLYVISYILFATLPERINKAPLIKRSGYFVLFYIFCVLIFIWI